MGLPYDWRLSPDKMEDRDGFLTLTRRRIEAAVQSNGKPGIMISHSMGNLVFRYFLEWMREQLKEEAYTRYIKQAQRRAKALQKAAVVSSKPHPLVEGWASLLPGWMSGTAAGVDDWLSKMTESDPDNDILPEKHEKLWQLAQMEGDDMFYEWTEKHIWSYVGLSAPMLGAINPLRAVLSGENMGLPLTDEAAREMELTFGSTNTVNPISTKEGFCDSWDAERWDDEPSSQSNSQKQSSDTKLACLDDIYTEVEFGSLDEKRMPGQDDPWEH